MPVTSSQIQCFLAAVETMSFTQAAQRMYLSQPGLSRQICALEQELGCSLLERGRGRRQVELTPQGRDFIEVAKKVNLLHVLDSQNVDTWKLFKMKNQKLKINIIGAGLAGCEAAHFLANKGFVVNLFEMRPIKQTGAHHSEKFAELVCSNSLKSKNLDNACGLLKEEIKEMGSITVSSTSYKSKSIV